MEITRGEKKKEEKRTSINRSGSGHGMAALMDAAAAPQEPIDCEKCCSVKAYQMRGGSLLLLPLQFFHFI